MEQDQEAQLKYHHGTFEVIKSGNYVRCSVTGQKIPLDNLQYWNVELQEPYLSVIQSMEKYEQMRKDNDKKAT